MSFLPHPLDFYLFTAGTLWVLAAVLLGTLAPEGREGRRCWRIISLGMAGVGLACFLALPPLALPDTLELPQAGLALAGIGLAVMLEGSRRAALGAGCRLPGSWAVLLLLAATLAMGLKGWAGLRFGAAGLALAASALLVLALSASLKRWKPAAGWALGMGLSTAALALAAGTPQEFPDHGILLAHIFCLGGFCWRLWDRRCQRSQPSAAALPGRLAAPLSFVLALLLGWALTQACGEFARRLQADRYQARLEQVHRLMLDHTALADRLATELASSLPGLRGPQVDQALDRAARVLPKSVAYVLDPQGRASASSNRAAADSFLGQDYGLRPYFIEALAGWHGRQAALGLTSRRTGYYSSAPLLLRGRLAGVVVVKMALEPELALEPGEKGFILDRQGAVLLAHSPGGGPASAGAAGSADLAPYSVELGVEGLRLVVLAPQAPIYVARLAGMGLTALLLLLVMVWALVLLRQAEMMLALKAGENRYKAVVEGIQELVYAYDARGIMTYVGPSVARYGYEPRQVVGRPMLDLVHPEDRAYVTAALGLALGQGVNRRELGLPALQFRILRADGTAVWFESAGGIQRGPQGQVLGIAGLLRDITERKAVEVERAQMQAQLIQSEKLASIGTLAAGVAHEINNPLAILKLNLANLRGLVGLPAAVAMMERMESAVDRVARIVGGLRVYARSSGEEQRPLDLHLLLQDTLALMEPILRKAGIEVSVDLACPKPVFLGNAGKMQQVMLNLLTNARDAVEGMADARIQLSTRETKGGIEFRVADNGPGVSPAIQGRIFEPFFSTKGVGGGTGLGLSISHGIVDGMGGKLRLESREGHGAVFCVELPRHDAPIQPLVEERPEPQLRRLAGKALVVDDEPEIRQSLSLLLQGLGLQVAEAGDGEEALELLRQEGFDYVITDQKMPRMAGDELVSRAQSLERCKQTRFVVITGGEPADLPPQRRDRLAQPGVRLVLKPFSSQDIIKALRQF
jgi:PAS domain S-box-containing protein